MSRPITLFVKRQFTNKSLFSGNHFVEASTTRLFSSLPDSVKRVGASAAFPNEYPGKVYAFNWALNRDGVTPLKESAFRITKPLDLKIAGLDQPKTNPLKVLLLSLVAFVLSWICVSKFNFSDTDLQL